MAANFYLSSHANCHLHPKSALALARADDLKHATEQELAWIEIWSGSVIQKLCKRLGLRQQVIASAIVFFRRFYLRNSYCDTEPSLVAAACCYVAAKAEETPVHVKSAVAEGKVVFTEMGVTNFPSDNTKLAEMEFYLIEELDFHLIVFHPYRSLVQICGRDGGAGVVGVTGEVSKGKNEEMLEMDDTALQMAWFVINDTFRSSLCLVYPPHLIALAAIYLAFSLHPPGPTIPSTGPAAHTRRQSTSAGSSSFNAPVPSTAKVSVGGKTDPVTFLASLDVDHSLVMEIVQQVISLYELWNELENEGPAVGIQGAGRGGKATTVGADERVVGILKRMRTDRIKELGEGEKAKGGTSWKK